MLCGKAAKDILRGLRVPFAGLVTGQVAGCCLIRQELGKRGESVESTCTNSPDESAKAILRGKQMSSRCSVYRQAKVATRAKDG